MNLKKPQSVRIKNAYARLSKFNVDTVHTSDVVDMTVTKNVFSKATILSRDTECDEDEDKIDRGFCNEISFQETNRYDEDQPWYKLMKPPE